MPNFIDTNILIASILKTDPHHELVEKFFAEHRIDIMESVYQELRQSFYEKSFSALTKLKKAISKANKLQIEDEYEEIEAIKKLTIEICEKTEPKILNFCKYIIRIAEEKGLLLRKNRFKLIKEMNDFIIEQTAKIDSLGARTNVINLSDNELETAIEIYNRVRGKFKDDYDAQIFSQAFIFSIKSEEECILYTIDKNFSTTANQILAKLKEEFPQAKLQVVYLPEIVEKEQKDTTSQ